MGLGRLSGIGTKAIFKLGATGGTYGTAIAGGAGDRIRADISPSYQSQELIKRMIGSGNVMQDDIIKGRITPTVALSVDVGYLNGAERLCSQFFGTSGAPTEQTATQGDYLHRMLLNPLENSVFGTFAYELTTTKVAELPSCAVTSIETSFSGTDEIMQLSSNLLGDDLILDSATNTNATILAATEAGGQCAIIKLADEFYMNLASGADFDAEDKFVIMGYTRKLERPQEHMGNVKGSAGNSKPLATDMATGSITLEVEALDRIDEFENWEAGDFLKCKLVVEGSQIGTGVNFAWMEYTPRMKLVQAPVYNVTESGFNSYTIEAHILQAPSNPTGMNSNLPYLEVINTRSTAYIGA